MSSSVSVISVLISKYCALPVLVDDSVLGWLSVLVSVDDVALDASVFTPLVSICATRSVCVSELDSVLKSDKVEPALEPAICLNKIYLNASLLACSC